MSVYILRRLLASVPVIFMVGVITFSILHIAPGDPAVLMAGEEATPEDVEKMRKALGFDRPFYVQFGVWVGNLLRGDLGTSIFSKHSIASLMAPRLQPTLSLGLIAIVLSGLIGVPMGVLAATYAGRFTDRACMIFAVLGFSVPVFWLGFIFIWVFAVEIRIFPAVGFVPISEGILPFLRSLTLPALANAIPFSALVARMTRSTMIEVLQEDYIRTARAKGLASFVVTMRHAPPQRVHPHRNGDWAGVRGAGERRGGHRNRVRHSRPRQAAGGRRRPPRLPNRPSDADGDGGGVRVRKPDNRRVLRIPRPAHPILGRVDTKKLTQWREGAKGAKSWINGECWREIGSGGLIIVLSSLMSTHPNSNNG